ncbi:matrix remodeling-associated protein 8-like isoform X2 [Parambassis ranga]|uniref:Matrix remodeling-associated protein 8-like isoform X1 n=1 Tax=Parambassis ranga TaxID=210632 RepID=A0A6P7HJ87_9TELE|nr:matrix remodeling-associated protein 8-like isoform X1 [Parambassis ranga]XP_028255645.1 matrix remodeling-associated protein 8-like isoform X2 [Parambassis ranga]
MEHLDRVWLLLLCSLNSVVCQLHVEGHVNGKVVLPCVYTDGDSSSNIFWRDKGDRNVLDIIGGVEQTQTQNERFRGRVSSFPAEYHKGNFSITMKDLTMEDSGPYECHIPDDFQRDITLTVNAPRVVPTPPPSPAGGAAVTHPSTWLCSLLLCLCSSAV